jgi:hypothetical protein
MLTNVMFGFWDKPVDIQEVIDRNPWPPFLVFIGAFFIYCCWACWNDPWTAGFVRGKEGDSKILIFLRMIIVFIATWILALFAVIFWNWIKNILGRIFGGHNRD